MLLNDWFKRGAHWFREFMTAGRSKELCGSICEVISNRRVMSVSRSSAALKNANWLLARVLGEVFYSASVALFLSLTGERTEHSQMGLPQAGPAGAWMNQVEGEWAESAARERLNCKVKPHRKQGRQKFFSGHCTRRGDALFLCWWYLLTVWLNITFTDSVSLTQDETQEDSVKSLEASVRWPSSSPSTTLDKFNDLGVLTSLCLNFQIEGKGFGENFLGLLGWNMVVNMQCFGKL